MKKYRDKYCGDVSKHCCANIAWLVLHMLSVSCQYSVILANYQTSDIVQYFLPIIYHDIVIIGIGGDIVWKIAVFFTQHNYKHNQKFNMKNISPLPVTVLKNIFLISIKLLCFAEHSFNKFYSFIRINQYRSVKMTAETELPQFILMRFLSSLREVIHGNTL